MNVLEVLKKDHAKARDLFSQLEAATEGQSNKREELFRKLKEELTLHTKAEEQVFYPALRNAKQAQGLVEEAYDEHAQVKDLLEKIEGMPADGGEWKDAIADLKKKVLHHVEEEESQIFDQARQLLPGKELESMGDRVEQAKGH